MFQIIKIIHVIQKNARLLGKIPKNISLRVISGIFTKVGIDSFGIKMFQIIPHGQVIKKYIITFPNLSPKKVFDTSRKFTKNGTAA